MHAKMLQKKTSSTRSSTQKSIFSSTHVDAKAEPNKAAPMDIFFVMQPHTSKTDIFRMFCFPRITDFRLVIGHCYIRKCVGVPVDAEKVLSDGCFSKGSGTKGSPRGRRGGRFWLESRVFCTLVLMCLMDNSQALPPCVELLIGAVLFGEVYWCLMAFGQWPGLLWGLLLRLCFPVS